MVNSTFSGPTFLIPGASRSGTTALYNYLSQHPDIFLPDGKELHFFERNENYRRGLNFYESLYDGWGGERAVGEVSPPYWHRGITYEDGSYRWQPSDDAPKRIHDAYPDIDIVLTLRNPVTRLHSQYWKNVRQGYEDVTPLRRALKLELSGERTYDSHNFCWLHRNRYPTHVRRWLDLFDREQVLFILFEDWISDPEPALNAICDHLSIDQLDNWNLDIETNRSVTPRFWFLNQFYHQYINHTPIQPLLAKTGIPRLLDKLNSKPGKPELNTEMKKLLYREFAEDFNELEDLTGLDLDVWRELASSDVV
jgi:hypothetical protein